MSYTRPFRNKHTLLYTFIPRARCVCVCVEVLMEISDSARGRNTPLSATRHRGCNETEAMTVVQDRWCLCLNTAESELSENRICNSKKKKKRNTYFS